MKAALLLVSRLSLEACVLCSRGEESVKFITADADAIQELLDADGSISEEDCRAVCEITSDVSNLTCYEDDVVLHATSRFPLHAGWHEIATGMMTTGAGAGRSSVRRESSLQTSIAAEPPGRSALREVLSQQARKLRELRERAAEGA